MEIKILKNGTVVQTTAPYEVTEHVDVVIKDDVIAEVGKNLSEKYPLATVYDVEGKLVMPGMVCSHHHYYSGLSRGMLVSSGPQTDFIQILKEWWWRVDRALDEESVYYSSLICSLDAIAAGTTSCIDHHASPSFIEGSLSTIAKGMKEVGIRGATCYEMTNRNKGAAELKEGAAENIRFAESVDEERKEGKKPLVEAMIGGHAPFTIDNNGLQLMKDAADRTNRGIHLHVAEDVYDVTYSHHHYHQDIIDRLDSFGLLNEKSLLVHGLYLNDKEIATLNERKAFLAHNPRSNMNNHVGYFSKLQDVEKLVLGTDGCGGNMFEEIKLAFFKHRDNGGSWWPNDFSQVLTRGNRLLESMFNENFGVIAPGYKADITIIDYNSPTPFVNDNVATHIVWGMSSNSVSSVMVDGNMIMHERRFDLDVERIYAKAAEAAKKVWNKVDTLSAH
ncbi:MAG: putative aminohydrolase SsnA [Sphaerochaetaceae bacterium]|nr:putative aminohydrolase SsnA [Sphaerochaetaceae bacterium]